MGIPAFGRVSSSVSAPRSGGVRTGGTTRRRTTCTLRRRSSSRSRRSTYSRSRRLPRRRSTGTTARAPRPITRPSRRVLSRGSRFLRGPSDEDAARLSRRGRPADDRVRDGARRAERDGTTGQRKELRAVPGGRRGLPSVGGATDRTTTKQAATESAVSGAAIGTVLGAAAGAAVGAAAKSPATGAAVGAGAGLLGGAAIGGSNAQAAGTQVQHRYDMTYMQCMYAKGNQIPMARGSFPSTYVGQPAASPPPPPPPPPGAPPPPPPGPMR